MEAAGEMRAFNASFCDWERDLTRPGRDATGRAGSELCHTECWSRSWHSAASQVMPFHVVLLLAIHSQLLTEGLPQGHLKAESAPALKCPSFVSWSVSDRGRAGFWRIAPTWCSQLGDSAAAPLLSAAKPPVHPTVAVGSDALYCGEL